MSLGGHAYLLIVLLGFISRTSAMNIEACNCRCMIKNTMSKVCDVLGRVETSAENNGKTLTEWSKYLPFIKGKHAEWEREELFNTSSEGGGGIDEIRLNAAINRVAQQLATDLGNERKARMELEGFCNSSMDEIQKQNQQLKTDLKSAKDQLEKLKTDLEIEKGARIDIENKMTEIEQKLSDVLSKTEDIEGHVKMKIDPVLTTQQEINRKISNQLSIIEENEEILEFKVKNMELILKTVEHQSRNLERGIKAETKSREELEKSVKDFGIKFQNENDVLQRDVSDIGTRLHNVEAQAKSFESAITLERNARNALEAYTQDSIEELLKKIDSSETYSKSHIDMIEKNGPSGNGPFDF